MRRIPWRLELWPSPVGWQRRLPASNRSEKASKPRASASQAVGNEPFARLIGGEGEDARHGWLSPCGRSAEAEAVIVEFGHDDAGWNRGFDAAQAVETGHPGGRRKCGAGRVAREGVKLGVGCFLNSCQSLSGCSSRLEELDGIDDVVIKGNAVGEGGFSDEGRNMRVT